VVTGWASGPGSAGYADFGVDIEQAGRDLADCGSYQAGAFAGCLAAVPGRLTQDEMAGLEELYVPHPVLGLVDF
jgi:hypothetical protein